MIVQNIFRAIIYLFYLFIFFWGGGLRRPSLCAISSRRLPVYLHSIHTQSRSREKERFPGPAATEQMPGCWPCLVPGSPQTGMK